MSTDAIISICLAATISIIAICVCINSCVTSKYFYETSDEDNNEYYKGYSNFFSNTIRYTFPEEATVEERLRVLEKVLNDMNLGSYNLRIDGKIYSKEDLEAFIKNIKKENGMSDKDD